MALSRVTKKKFSMTYKLNRVFKIVRFLKVKARLSESFEAPSS